MKKLVVVLGLVIVSMVVNSQTVTDKYDEWNDVHYKVSSRVLCIENVFQQVGLSFIQDEYGNAAVLVTTIMSDQIYYVPSNSVVFKLGNGDIVKINNDPSDIVKCTAVVSATLDNDTFAKIKKYGISKILVDNTQWRLSVSVNDKKNQKIIKAANLV